MNNHSVYSIGDTILGTRRGQTSAYGVHVQCFTLFFSVRFLRGVYLSESSVGENWEQDGH